MFVFIVLICCCMQLLRTTNKIKLHPLTPNKLSSKQ